MKLTVEIKIKTKIRIRIKTKIRIRIKTKIRIRIRKTYSLLFSWFTMTSAPPSFSSAVMADLLTQNDIKPIILSSFP